MFIGFLRASNGQATGCPSWVKISHTCFPMPGATDGGACGASRIILLVRLAARAYHRSLTCHPPCSHSTLFHARWCASGAWITAGETQAERSRRRRGPIYRALWWCGAYAGVSTPNSPAVFVLQVMQLMQTLQLLPGNAIFPLFNHQMCAQI